MHHGHDTDILNKRENVGGEILLQQWQEQSHHPAKAGVMYN